MLSMHTQFLKILILNILFCFIVPHPKAIFCGEVKSPGSLSTEISDSNSAVYCGHLLELSTQLMPLLLTDAAAMGKKVKA